MRPGRFGWLATWVALAVVVVVPVFRLLVAGFPDDGWAVGGISEPLVASLLTSVLAALIATTGGVAAALATERFAVPGRRLLRFGLVAALLVPPFVTAVAWQAAYGPAGLLDRLAGTSFGWVEGPVGVVLVIAVNALPLVFLIAAATLSAGGELELERAARSSGAGAWTTLRTVTLPLLAPAATAGGVLSFVIGMNSFGVPMILGSPSGFGTLTTEIYRGLRRAYGPDTFEQVLAMAVVLLVVSATVAFLVDIGRPLVVPGSSRAAPMARVGTSPQGVVAATAGGLYVAFTLGGPMLALVLRALTRAVGLAPTPANWTLANFAELVGGRTSAAAGRSLGLAAAAATIVLVLAGMSNWAARTGHRLPGVLATAGFAVPGSALAVAVMLAYSPLVGTGLALILAAYLAKFWALGHRPLAASLERMGLDVLRAARSSGASGWVALRTVVVGALWPALAVGWVTVFLFAVHELTMSSILHGPGTATLAVVILDHQQIGDPTVTAALAVALTGIVGLFGGVLWLARRAWRQVTP